MKPDQPAAWLHAVDAFASLGQPELRRLLVRCFTQTVARGDSLTQAGEEANALHVVISGRLSVHDEARTVTREIGPGAVINDVAFFTRGPCVEAVMAARESLVLTLEWDEFTQLADRAPEYWQAVAIALARRVEAKPATVQRRFPTPRTLAILGAGPSPLRAEIIAEITAAFDPLADCQVLRSATFGQNLPGGITLDDPEVAHWLKEQQQEFDLIIRIADDEPNAWTRVSILEADEILLVAEDDGGGDRALNSVERLAFELRGAHACRLVIVTDRAQSIARAGGWLASRRPRFHHRVSLAPSVGFDSLARFVLGRATGYIACGGASFAAAHLGLLQALKEAGVAVDCFGGTGAGALAAALMAQGAPFDEAQAFFPPPRNRADFERQIAEAFGGLDIQDMEMPFRALSADLSTGVPVVHATGAVSEALLANWPPPGMATPFIAKSGVHLADGGMIDAAPAWLLSDVHHGPTILGRIEPPLPTAARDTPSAKDWALRRLTGQRGGEGLDPFDMANLMLRGMSLRGANGAHQAAALTLTPPFAFTEDGQERAREAAYEWAVIELERVLAAGEAPSIFPR